MRLYRSHAQNLPEKKVYYYFTCLSVTSAQTDTQYQTQE